MLQVVQPEQRKAALLYSKFYNDKIETAQMTATVAKLVKQFQPLQLDFGAEYETAHEIEKIADALEIALKSDSQIIFIVSGRRNGSRDDTIAAAVRSIADEVVVCGIPQVGVSDLLVAVKRDKKIIVLPFDYGRIDSTLVENDIKLALIKEKISPADFNHPQNVRLLAKQKFEESVDNGLIRVNHKTKPGSANIAAVILAAGVGRRIGRNKLLYEIDDEPLFLRAVRAAVRSQASPVFVVIGDHAVPNFCDGVLLLPADMPNITPEFINKMIKNFDKKADKQLVTAAVKGIKTNPVIWGKSLYDVADLVPENANLRPVFLEHSDYTKAVKGDEYILLDVNYPYDLERLEK